MFAGHYAAALAAKAAEPRAPLWTLVAGAQLIDIGWGALVMTGIEHGRVDPTLPGTALVLEHMPFTHSLPAVIAWSLAAAILARYALRLVWPAAIVIAAVVFSHWLLDLLVHVPDLTIAGQPPKLGLGLWNHPMIEMPIDPPRLRNSAIRLDPSGRRLWSSVEKAISCIGVTIMPKPIPWTKLDSNIGVVPMSSDQPVIIHMP